MKLVSIRVLLSDLGGQSLPFLAFQAGDHQRFLHGILVQSDLVVEIGDLVQIDLHARQVLLAEGGGLVQLILDLLEAVLDQQVVYLDATVLAPQIAGAGDEHGFYMSSLGFRAWFPVFSHTA